jgi:hypothetical protein
MKPQNTSCSTNDRNLQRFEKRFEKRIQSILAEIMAAKDASIFGIMIDWLARQ